MPVTGAVLAGGASTRMGSPKALLDVDGVTLIERVAAALAGGGCAPILVVGIPPGVDPARVEHIAEHYGWTIVADDHPGEGPLGGILTALDRVDGDVVITACDLVDLDASTVRTMLVPASRAVDVVQAETDRPQPLLCRWSPSARAYVRQRFAAGERSVHAVLGGLVVERRSVDAAALRNVNTPADLGSWASRRGSVPETTAVTGEKDEFIE